MKKTFISILVAIILLLTALLLCYPKRTWEMMLFQNIFQYEAHYQEQMVRFKPFEVMLSNYEFVDSTSTQIKSIELIFKENNNEEASFVIKNLPVDQQCIVNGYTIKIDQISYNSFRNSVNCIIGIEKRVWIWQ